MGYVFIFLNQQPHALYVRIRGKKKKGYKKSNSQRHLQLWLFINAKYSKLIFPVMKAERRSGIQHEYSYLQSLPMHIFNTYTIFQLFSQNIAYNASIFAGLLALLLHRFAADNR